MMVYRAITAPVDWKPTADRHLGIYWTWDVHAAEAHWSEGNGVEWLLTARVTAAEIDWIRTLTANCDPTLGEDEKEITLNPASQLNLLAFERV